MNTLWKYAENTFEVVTRGSFKLMSILITDHKARCTLLSNADPMNQTLIDALTDATATHAAWTAAYTAWDSCRGEYKGTTQAFYQKLEELSSLKIRQWDAGIQTMFLEGTPEYTTLLPQGREPFQKGALDMRVAAVRTLADRLVSYPVLTILMGQVNAFLTELDTLRASQQLKETEVDTCSAALEVQRVATASQMYRNLGRFMVLYWQNPVQIEDCFDMNYIRDGAPPPPEDEPEPIPPAPPTP